MHLHPLRTSWRMTWHGKLVAIAIKCTPYSTSMCSRQCKQDIDTTSHVQVPTKVCPLTGHVRASLNSHSAFFVSVLRALGKLVRIHLPPRPPATHLLSHHLPSQALGSSCVAWLKFGCSTTSATQGALLSTSAVVACINDSASVVVGVDVHAKRAINTSSGTPTSPPQLPRICVHEVAVDVAAKFERGSHIATPTTPPAIAIVHAAMACLPRPP